MPPDLSSAAARAAYRRELRNVAQPLRRVGLFFALLGAALALARAVWFPALPLAVPLATLGLGALNLLFGIVLRLRYHQARMHAQG